MSYTEIIKEEDLDKVEVLKSGIPCRDYPKVMQTSVECQNCRFNRFMGGDVNKQKCVPHTQAEAKRKGAPGYVPSTHFTEWMEEVERRRMERKMRGELVEED